MITHWKMHLFFAVVLSAMQCIDLKEFLLFCCSFSFVFIGIILRVYDISFSVSCSCSFRDFYDKVLIIKLSQVQVIA